MTVSLPSASVREVVRYRDYTPVPGAPPSLPGILHQRGTIVPVVVPSICLYLAVGTIFWIESRRQETLADRMLAISFFAWAGLRLTIFLVLNGGTAGADEIGMKALGAVPAACVAMLMVMAT